MKKNILRTLKMAVFFSLGGLILQMAFFSLLFASSVTEAQKLNSVKVSINLQQESIEKTLNTLEEKSGFKFFYLKEEIPLDQKVSLFADNASLRDVLEDLSAKTNLVFNKINGQIVVKPFKTNKRNYQKTKKGKIIGIIIDVKTKEPLISANVMVKGRRQGTITETDGSYEILNIPAGKVKITANYIGYKSVTIEAIVENGKTTLVDFELKPSLMDLDEVVVAGSITEVKKKTAPNPVTIIDTKRLERMPIQNLSDLFSGYIPGAYSTESEVGTVIGLRGSAGFGSQVKIYVDGIHLTQNEYSSIDFRNVEKVEVLRGPQATTLYGSGAAGGVILITTKQAKEGELKVTLNNSIGFVKKNYASESPIERNHQLSLSSGNHENGYAFSVRQTAEDPIAKSNDITPTSLYAGGNIKLTRSSVQAVLSGSYQKTKLGTIINPIMAKREIEKKYPYKFFSKLQDLQVLMSSQILNLNLKHFINNNWLHQLIVGYSGFMTEGNTLSQEDSSSGFRYDESTNKEYNIKYVTSYNKNFNDFSIQVSGGLEYITSDRTLQRAIFNKKFDVTSGEVPRESVFTRGSYSNTGYFAEGLWGYKEKLFLTTAIRLEDHESYGQDVGLVSSPRVGLAYTVDAGWLVMKPRVSYGAATNPPDITAKLGSRDTQYGYTVEILPNPDLKPSKQVGYEIGSDFYLGDNLFFEITYFNQDVDDVITTQEINTTPTSTIQKNVNFGNIKNKGFELALTTNFGSFDLNAAYTLTDAKSTDLFDPQYFEGDDGLIPLIPKHTGSLNLNYNLPEFLSVNERGGNISLEATYKGKMKGTNTLAQNDALYLGLPPGTTKRFKMYKGYTMLRVRMNYWFTNFLQLYVDARNLTNRQLHDGTDASVRKGRVFELGCFLEF